MADAEGDIPLEDGIADAVFSVTVLSEIPNPIKTLHQINRLMKEGAVYADAELLLDPDYPLRRTVIKLAQAAGLQKARQTGNFFRYVLVFKKSL